MENRNAGLEVAVLNHDLMSALAGNTITVTAADGTQVRLRLLTANEFYVQQHALVANSGMGSPVTRDRAAELTQPLDLFALIGRDRFVLGGAR